MSTMTREERTKLAVGMLTEYLSEHDGSAHEDKMEQTLSDLNYAIEDLERTLKDLPDLAVSDEDLLLKDRETLQELTKTLRGIAENVVGVRTDYGTLAQAWDNRA